MASKKKNKKLQQTADNIEKIEQSWHIDNELLIDLPTDESDVADEANDFSILDEKLPIEEVSDESAEESVNEYDALSEPVQPESTGDTSATPNLVRLVVVLTCICAGIALLLSVVNSVTKDVIIENQAKAKQEAILAVFPEGDAVEEYTTESGESVYIVLNEGKIIGYTVNAVASGYMGPVEMMIGMTSEGAVDGIKIVSTSETPGVGTKIGAESFLSLFDGFDHPVILGEDVDAISGATFSSRAVEEAVNYAVSLDVDLNDAASKLKASLVNSSGEYDDYQNANDDNGDSLIDIGEVGVDSDETESLEIETTETEPVDTAPAETEPDIPVIAEPEIPVETEPEIPVETETEVPAVIEPELPSEPETLPIVEPELPVETVPTEIIQDSEAPAETAVENPTPVESETSAEPETPVEIETVEESETDAAETDETAETAAETDETTETEETAQETEPEEIETVKTEPETEESSDTQDEAAEKDTETEETKKSSNKGGFVFH